MTPTSVYRRLPRRLRRPLRRAYHRWLTVRSRGRYRDEFREAFFDAETEFERYTEEFRGGPVPEIYRDRLAEFYAETDSGGVGTLRETVAERLYTLVRRRSPTVVVETGVCNGLSTLSILSALARNDHGHLYSIDYPYYADEPLAEFRRETFEGYGGAAIPADKSPGWVVPDDLRDRWTLRLGRSQRELPRLVTELDGIDLFVHDSEHSLPAMLFEFELGWEWLEPGGVLVADDIGWNEAFESFHAVRGADHGRLAADAGYLQKPEGE